MFVYLVVLVLFVYILEFTHIYLIHPYICRILFVYVIDKVKDRQGGDRVLLRVEEVQAL